MGGTTLTSKSATVDLASYGTGNPFSVNSGTAISISGVTTTGDAIYGSSAQTWTLTNAGLIAGAYGESSVKGGDGLDLRGGANITNSGTIAAGSGFNNKAKGGIGVYFYSAASTLSNTGVIDGGDGGSVGGVSAAGVDLRHGGVGTNAGTIVGGGNFSLADGAGGTGFYQHDATVTNVSTGVIDGGEGGEAVGSTFAGGVGGIGDMAYGGVLVNQAGGAIKGGIGGDAEGDGSPGGGAGGVGVYLEIGGSLSNLGTVTGGYGGGGYRTTRSGAGGVGVELLDTCTLTNSGAIQGGKGGYGPQVSGGGGDGADAFNGSVLTNASGGRITGGAGGIFGNVAGAAGAGGRGVTVENSTLTNAGTIQGGNGGFLDITPSYLGAAGVGVLMAGSSYLVNSGEIAAGEETAVATGGAVGVVLGGIEVLTNQSGGQIIGGTGGVGVASGGNGGAGGAGVYLQSDGSTVFNAGTIEGGYAGLGRAGGYPGPGGVGVSIQAGGYVVNTGLIEGGDINPLSKYGAAPGVGVFMVGVFGTVTNQTGGVIDGGVVGETSDTVTNAGTIMCFAYNGVAGVNLTDYGVVTNQAGASITGSGGAFGTVAGSGVHLFKGGKLTNAGTITGGAGAATSAGGAGVSALAISYFTNMANSGVIVGGVGGSVSGVAGDGVYVGGYGKLTNSGSVQGAIGVYFNNIGYGDTLINSGTIVGTAGKAVRFKAGSDLLVLDAGAVFTGSVYGGSGGSTLELAAADGAGTLTGIGTQFTNFDALKVDTGANWTLSGAETLAAGDTLTNSGVLIVSGDLTNLGMIVSPAGVGVTLAAHGVLTNGASATKTASITGVTAVYAGGAGATVTNYGTLMGKGTANTTAAAAIANGAVLINKAGALVEGYNGVRLSGGGSVTNAGTVEAVTSAGVYVTSGSGFVVNQSGSLMEGGHYAVFAGVTATVTNAGTMTGGVQALHFGVATDRLILDPGAVFNGAVAGGGGTLELTAGTGTISSLGGSFGGFGTTVVDLGGTWALQGSIGGSITSRGVLEATGAGGLSIAHTKLTQSGGGTVFAANGSVVSLTSVNDSGGTFDTAGTGVIVTADGGTALDGRTSTVNNEGLFEVANGDRLLAHGTFNNTGTIEIESTGAITDLLFDVSSTLKGGGTILMGNNADNTVRGANTSIVLTNVDNTISGAGNVGSASMNLNNQTKGVIDATGSFVMVLDTGGNTITNAGLLEGAGTAGLRILSTTVNDATTGVISAGVGSRVSLEGADIEGGTITTTGTGIILTQTGTNLIDGTASAVTNEGAIRVGDNTALGLAGTIDNVASITVASAGHATTLMVQAAGVTLTGSGDLTLGNSATNIVEGAVAGATLTNVNNRITGAGQLGDGQMTLVNQSKGVINADDALALIINTGANTIVNAGVIQSTAAGGGVIDSAVANTGILRTVGGNLTVNGAVTGAGVATVSGGILDFASTFNENVTFTGTTGVLELAQSQSYTGKITGFSTTGGTSLHLTDVGFASSTEAVFTGTATGGVLTVTDGAEVARITLVGDYLSSTFTTTSDLHGGVIITDPTKTAAAPATPTHAFVAAMASLGATPGAGHSVNASTLGAQLPMAIVLPDVMHQA